MPTLKQNEIFANRYQLIKKLGVGGYSEVWLVKDNKAGGMEVALKIYSPEKGLDDKGLETFSKEFSLVFNLNHAGLLKPTYFDDYEGSPYLVMPYCKNASMADKIGNITEKELASFIHQAASALAYLHKKEPPIIHQDIKPDNFLIDDEGNYLLADFGISSKIRKTLTKTMGEKNSSGTMAYMPPEKFSRDRQTIKAGDIFSLGITLYELLTGELAFGEHGGLSLHGGAEIPDLPKQYSSELNDLIRSCMAKDPWDRPTADTLEEIAKNYELTGKWDISKLPIAKKEVYEEPIIIPKEPEKPKARETVQIPVNETENKKEVPFAKGKSRKVLIISTLLFIIISSVIGYLYLVKDKDYYIEEATTVDSTMVEETYDITIDTTNPITEKGETNTATENVVNNAKPTETNGWQTNYDKVYAFFFGRAVVMKSGKYGYVDTNGKLVIPLQYQDAYDFRTEGLALVKKNGLFGFIDKNGNVVIDFYYEKANSFVNGKAYVYYEGSGWYYIDRNGEFVEEQKKETNTKQNSSKSIKILKIGDTYAGGIIFYLDASGQHGKVCAKADQSVAANWNTAIYICNNLILDSYNDWYLPSKDELDKMYNNLYKKNLGDLKKSCYWSSSETDYNSAWYQCLISNGYQTSNLKSCFQNVRAIRAF